MAKIEETIFAGTKNTHKFTFAAAVYQSVIWCASHTIEWIQLGRIVPFDAIVPPPSTSHVRSLSVAVSISLSMCVDVYDQ